MYVPWMLEILLFLEISPVFSSLLTVLVFKVFGIVGPIELPFNGCPLDACKSLIAGDCPVEEDEILVYELVLEVNGN